MKFEHLPLQTERLLLRPLVPEDTQALFGIFSDPLVVRWGSSPAWTEMSQADEFVQRAADAQAAGTSLRLALVRREDDRLIGQCTLYAVSDQNRRAEMGYTMASDSWGRGYMNEALHALIDYGFETLDMIRIEADIDPRNLASARTLERLGFAYEGLMPDRWIVAGVVSDTGWYGLLREHWRARGAKPVPCDPASVSLREISAEMVRPLHALKVAQSQQGFVAPNALSLAQALFAPCAWYRAIYCAQELAGFVMLDDESLKVPPPEHPQIGVWRLMIDAAFQGRGVGRAAMQLVIAHARAKGFEKLALSYVPGPGCPEPFYRSLGFAPNGQVQGVEIVMELRLRE
ncbi:GNAT family N-acetyltransferase [Burkholderiaceae bacterium UC74_6]